jgi:hypothetical protein
MPISVDPVDLHILLEIKRLQDENSILREWIKLGRDEHLCVVCGKPIKNVSIQRKLRPYLWCSRKCFQFKPRKIISLEHEYQLTITDILRETTERYGEIRTQCEALDVSVPYFYHITRKYCGDYHGFMAKYTTGKRRTSYAKKFKDMCQGN